MKEKKSDHGQNYVSLFIALLTLPMAISTMHWSNTTSDAITHSINVVNAYSFYQAKSTRQSVMQLNVDDLDLELKIHPPASATAKKLIEDRIATLHANITRYQSDVASGEGKKELLAKAKELEVLRDDSLRKSTYFAYGMIILQIAIVLASASQMAKSAFLLYPSVLISIIGFVIMLNGFYLFTHIPFL